MAALAGVGEVTIRELSAADDLDALLDLSCRAFGPVAPADRERWQAGIEASIGGRQFLAAFEGSRLVAAARYFDMAQWWHGRCMPMAGVASVMVAPEDRGRGAGGALMTALLGLIAERGYPLSVLYPATMAIYRSLGWEIAGVQDTVAIPARSLRSLVPPDPWLGSPEPADAGPGGVAADGVAAELRRCGPQDAGQVLAALGAAHQALRDSGPNTRDEARVRRWLGDGNRFAYLARDGFLAYRWLNGNDEILVERAVAGSAATTRALWAIVASHSSMASTVRGYLGPADPVGWLTREPDVALARRRIWMLRLVDAAGAVAGRGFPPAAEVRAELRLTDTACPRNDGTWTLEVSGGKGVLGREPSPGVASRAAPLAAGARGFAALFAGTPVATLRRVGLVSGGDPGNDAALDSAFAASAFLLDYF
jgi:GNAT superfamily N-acetyltransferase